MDPALLVRSAAVWLLLMAGEIASGVLRTILLTPLVGDFSARQMAVVPGSLIVVVIAYLTSSWLAARTTGSQLAVGCLWVMLTVGFEITLGRVLGLSWERIAADYRITEGGLLPLGLLVMAMAPLIAARLNAGSADEPA